MSEKHIGMVRFELNPNNPPKMSDEHVQALRDLRDEDIDLSDIPPQEHKPWRRPGAVLPGAEQQALVLEKDVLEFFRRKGDASSERINAVLREYVEAHQDAA